MAPLLDWIERKRTDIRIHRSPLCLLLMAWV
jgi:hypothetical protein